MCYSVVWVVCQWGVWSIIVRWIVVGVKAPPYKEETRTCIRQQSKKTNDTTSDTAAEHVVMCGGRCDRAATRRRSVEEHLIVGMGEGAPGGGWGRVTDW